LRTAEFINEQLPLRDLSRLTRLALLAIDAPSKAKEALAASEDLLTTENLPPEACDRALLLLASVMFTRPDLLRPSAVDCLRAILSRPDLPPSTIALAGEMMTFLLTTPLGARAVEATFTVLFQPNHTPEVYDALLGTLRHAATWVKELLDFDTLLDLSEVEQLRSNRDYLFQHIVEPCVYATGGSLNLESFTRLVLQYHEADDLKYCLYYVQARTDFRPEVRENARTLLQDRFSLHEVIARRLGAGKQRILVVQNVNDGQGDEIVRVAPLIQAFLDFNPAIEIVLVTRRVYLYASPRLELVRFKDRQRIEEVLEQNFDVVIDFFEPTVPEVNHDPDLEPHIQAHIEQHPPFLYVSSTKGHNHFVYESVRVESREMAESLGLDRQRVDNIYEPTFRLIAELGLPPRCGEDTSATESVLAGLRWSEAEAAWDEVTRQNIERRPVALLNPFGGAEPLKGCAEQHSDLLAAMISQLIRENFFVVLLPNGTLWGTAALAADVVRRLDSREQSQVVVGPDPAGTSDGSMQRVPGAPALTHADRVMRMIIYFIRFADIIVPVEGWMVHAAFCLAKKYRMLMMPYSYPDRWNPYACTRDQRIALGLLQCNYDSPKVTDAPPTPEQPRKFILLFLLRELGRSGDPRAIDFLRLAARSEDRDLRQAAALALGKLETSEVEPDLIALLQDSFRGVRAAAAEALLERQAREPLSSGELSRDYLTSFVVSGRELRDWVAVIRIGEAARPALELALQDDDPVVRREALQVNRVLDFKANLHRRSPSLRERLARNRVLRRLFRQGHR